jgi:uncharacterized membrane protein YdjX (TVP38/TMEM64 family)
MRKYKKHLIKFTILIAIIVAVISIAKMFNLTHLLNPETLREMVLSYGIYAPLIFILIYILVTIFFLPGTPASIAGGLIFGATLGTLYVVTGATIGAIIAFTVARLLGEQFIEDILKGKYKKLYEYDKKIEKSGFMTVLILRLVPIFPFNALNFALGLTRVKFKDYALATLLGIIPGSFALAFFGAGLGQLNISHIIGASLLFITLMFIPKIHKRFKKGETNDS